MFTHPMNTPFSTILNALGHALVVIDTLARVTYANRTACETFSCSPVDCVGADLDSVVPGFPFSPRELPDERLPEFTYMHPDGERYLVSMDPVHIHGERMGSVLCFRRDRELPRQDRTDSRLQHLAEIMQAAFHSSSDGIWITDGKGKVLDINKASESLNNITADQVLGRNLSELVKEGIIDRSATLEVIRKKRRVSVLQVIRRTGRQLVVTGTPSFKEDGSIGLIVVNERDITDLNELRHTLSQLRKVKDKAQAQLTELSLLELKKGQVVAESPAMRQTLATAAKLAQMETSEILLIGESGTGKGLLAKYIHDSSPRNGRPFIQVNCATLPPQLFEAELFGYEKGAFTGALQTGKSGLLELAADGTFFLDEVGELPLEIQAKLLKCLDEHEYYPLGAGLPRQMRCIIVAATNRELEECVRRKEFREDLFYRLNTFTVRIPPLRERPEDIFELVNHYLSQFNTIYKSSKSIGMRGISLLQKHHFSGNVRELIGLLKKAVVIAEDDQLDAFLEEMLGPGSPAAKAHLSLPQAVAETEIELLRRAMAVTSGTRDMAELLGISQSAVVRKMHKHNLKRK